MSIKFQSHWEDTVVRQGPSAKRGLALEHEETQCLVLSKVARHKSQLV